MAASGPDPAPPPVRAHRALPPALAALCVGGVGIAAWPYAVDDAWVIARYARRIVGGLGYTFVDGPPTDGVTGPLGLVPALVAEALAGEPILGQKLAGLAATMVSAAWATAVAGREAPRAGVVTACLLALWPLLGVWSVAGLETGLATLACTAAGVGLLARRGALLGGAVAALAWLRPEAAPACLVALALHTRAAGRGAGPAWALALAGAASVLAFRLAMFGALLPTSLAAKPPDLGHGLEYAARAFLVVLGVFGVLPLALATREPTRRELALVLAVHACAVVLAGGDWMPGFRLFVPWLPAAALVMAGPIAARLDERRRLRGVALLAGATLVPLVAGVVAIGDAREAGATRDTAGRALAEHLATHARRVALLDVGYVGFATGLDVVDLGGITDPRIARLPGGHADKAIDPGELAARDPDALVLSSRIAPVVGADGRLRRFAGHPVEARVAAFAWVRESMRVTYVAPYGPRSYYVVLSR
ncbi:MAG: hypothetical protein KF729_01665 [Sandaracinaceae bacterium]|nr:hypothetical protein [Sandaracinaceae bacterium]